MDSIKIFYGPTKRIEQVPIENPDEDFDSVRKRWVGRSCGCAYSNIPGPENLANPLGITLYPGHSTLPPKISTDLVVHVTTKNGPLTLVMAQAKPKR